MRNENLSQEEIRFVLGIREKCETKSLSEGIQRMAVQISCERMNFLFNIFLQSNLWSYVIAFSILSRTAFLLKNLLKGLNSFNDFMKVFMEFITEF